MANYTYSVRDILQFNKLPNENLVNISDVYAIANRSLFNVDGINAISEAYREKLITGFALHFMNDEIGYETIPLWKIALNEKLYNSGSYINKIFENIDKEVFADYRVRQVNNEGSTEDTKNATGSTSTERDVSVSGEDSNTKNYNWTDTADMEHTTSGTDTTTLTKEGSETRIRDGYDDVIKSGSEVQKNVGTDTTTDDGTQDNVSSNASGNYTNGVQVVSDTPMGSLSNLRSPGGDVDDNTHTSSDIGTNRDFDTYGFGGDRGYDYADGQTYNYMSGATETDQTVTNVENGNEAALTHNVSETEHGHIVGTTYGKDELGTTDERKDRTDYNSTDTMSYGVNGSGTIDARKDITAVQKNTTVSDEGTNARTGRDVTTGTNSSTTSDDTSQTSSNEETSTGTHVDETNEIDYTMNWEMLYKSMPLLNKVWEIFDDLFMIIF